MSNQPADKRKTVQVQLSKDPGVSLSPSSRSFEKILENIFTILPSNAQIVELHLTSSKGMKSLNKKFRQWPKTTDVLSFESSTPGLLGSLAIDLETAKKQARQNRHSLKQELEELFIHGVLHLLGFDHERPCEKKLMASYEFFFRGSR